jgi:4-amino-4-deoxy-L-arabinose transferase-like glycosyltransferase
MQVDRGNLESRAIALDLGLLAGLWIVAALLVNPGGNFPLNDDWAYAQTVRGLVAGHGFRLHDWTATVFIAQAYWGALFCRLFGFSFVALRFSTLVLGLGGILATYGLVRAMDGTRPLALVSALALAFNPLYLGLSYTFMTDVPFTAVATMALLAMVVGNNRERLRVTALGGVLAAAATLIRPLGLALPAGLVLGATLARKRLSRWAAVTALALVSVAAYVLVDRWVRASHPPALYNINSRLVLHRLTQDPLRWWRTDLRAGFVVAMYLGLFALPVAVATGRGIGKSRWLVVGLVALFVVRAVKYRAPMPYVGNVLCGIGMGPATLVDENILGLHRLPQASAACWYVVTGLAALGAAGLFAAAIHFIRRALSGAASQSARQNAVLLVCCGALCAVPLLVQPFFDRYLLVLIPVSLAVIAASAGRLKREGAGTTNWVIAGLLVTALAVFSVSATHDYLSWNRARWQALDYLTQAKGIQPDRIDGGFEFNGSYTFDPKFQASPGHSWWWVARDDYLVTFGPLPDTRVCGVWFYPRWLPPGRGEIFALERINAASPRL